MPVSWTDAEIELVAERAYELQLQGKYLDAAALFEGLLAIDPRNLYCLEALAALSLKLGSAENALEYANRALALLPGQVKALSCRCEANLLLNNFAAAQEDFQSMKQPESNVQVARLAMRIANAGKLPPNSLPDTTSQEVDR
jgi:predicted Zn-dependent protease